MSALPLLVTPGDPAGIGPEVAIAALRQEPQPAILVGDGPSIRREALRQGVSVFEGESGDGFRLWVCEGREEPPEIEALRVATRACLEGRGAALVTGPIHKARLAARGFAHRGHTEFLAELCDSGVPTMAFVGRQMRVALVTTHIPLSQVPGALSIERIGRVLRQADRALREDLGVGSPRLVVCGLNPHAGEEGLLGTEDQDIVHPACVQARQEGIDVLGPLSAEAAARAAATGAADMMVAMYHDQGLVPLKVLDFGGAVNWTLGLPIIRTSVDHGTADDIADQGVADPGSMACALALAREIADRRALARRSVTPGAR
jgi:4-hydroxythreonine-4-phosphate dehydrogenase